MRRLGVLFAAGAVLSIAVVAGCGGEEGAQSARPKASASQRLSPASSASPSGTPPTASPSPTLPTGLPELGHDKQARKELRGALTRWIIANTGTFRLDAGFTGAGIQEVGRYRLRPRAFDVTRFLSGVDGTLAIAYRGIGRRTWFRIVEGPTAGQEAWPCWVDLGDMSEIRELAGLPAMAPALPGQPPNALIAASYGIGREYSEAEDLGTILGTTDLVLALSVLNSGRVDELGLDPSSTATVPTYFDVRDGTFHGYTIGLRGLFLAIEAAGGDAPMDTSEPILGDITVRFEDQGTKVEVTPPRADKVIAFTDAFKADMAACGARRG